MARITVEDCLEKVDNRFGLIHLAAKRVRQLRNGAEPLVVCKNKDIVVALREIAAGEVWQWKESDGIPMLENGSEQMIEESFSDVKTVPEKHQSLDDSEKEAEED